MTDESVIAYSSVLPLARCAIIEFIAVTDFVTMAYDTPRGKKPKNDSDDDNFSAVISGSTPM